MTKIPLWKPLLIMGVVTLSAFVLSMIYSSAQLIKKFEGAEQREYKAESGQIEVVQIKADSKMGWRVNAARSHSDPKLSQIWAEDIQATLFDESGAEKLLITADQAQINRENFVCILDENPEAQIVGQDTTLLADKFLLGENQPLEATGDVRLHLNQDGSKMIVAEKAIISEDLAEITFYQVQRSPLGPGKWLQGGRLHLNLDENAKEILLSDGATFVSGNTRSTASTLRVYLDDQGQASTAVFSGNARAKQGANTLQAQQIRLHIPSNTLRASGSVQIN